MCTTENGCISVASMCALFVLATYVATEKKTLGSELKLIKLCLKFKTVSNYVFLIKKIISREKDSKIQIQQSKEQFVL